MIEKMNAKKLAEAIRGYDIDQLKKLLKDGASPDEYTDKDSYLFTAGLPEDERRKWEELMQKTDIKQVK
jgi:hypothetical protein